MIPLNNRGTAGNAVRTVDRGYRSQGDLARGLGPRDGQDPGTVRTSGVL